MAAAGAAVLAAVWVRAPGVPYLVGIVAATVAAVALAWRAPAARMWLATFSLGALAFVVVAARTERQLARIDRNWARYQTERVSSAVQTLEAELGEAARDLRGIAEGALDAPADTVRAFASVRALARGGAAERAVVLSRGGRPFAWGGVVRVSPDSVAGRPLGVSVSPFYVVLHAAADRGDRRAVATALIHAAPPGDTLALALDRDVRRGVAVRTFNYAIPAAVPPGDSGWYLTSATIEGRAVPLVSVRPAPRDSAETRVRAVEDARATAGPLLAVMILVALGAAWWGRVGLAQRLMALAVPLAAVVIVPLNSYSNTTRLFDPTVYLAPIGREFASSIGALAVTSGVVLVGLFAVLRSRTRATSRWGGALLLLAIAGGAPFLLRALSRGIAPPALGVPVSLWVAWQVALFLAAQAMLLAGAAAGRSALGRVRGLPASVGPVLAAVAALAGPVLWQAPAGWPRWYPALWIVAIIALALTRRTRAIVITATVVAGLASATLVWGATSRRRVDLARRDIAGLVLPDADAATFLDRFGRALADGTAPDTPPELLQRYAESPLAAGDFPVALASWTRPAAGDSIIARVSTTSLSIDSAALRPVVEAARRSGVAQTGTVLGDVGAVRLLAVPHDDGRVTSVALFPRARLAPQDPIAALLGLPRPVAGDASYTIALLDRGRAAVGPIAGAAPRWTREGNDIHGDWIVPTAGGSARAHVEVALRPLSALAQRGALLVLVDLLVVAALWALPAVADGAFTRRARVVARGWSHSYRARLTLALFAFFVVPAAAFAVWAYGELRAGDRQSRELLVREALRAAAEQPVDSLSALRRSAQRVGAPLLLYEGGALVRASEPLFLSLAPVGVFLPEDVALDVAFGDEVVDSRLLATGPTEALFGFRAAVAPNGRRVVLAAPARTNEATLDQRRRDLSFLVLLAVAGGALAALGLSGLAARELARPVGALRRAALAIASGAREPAFTQAPPAEFRPVFDAFRRMAADLAFSEAALDAARRRTVEVLRHVASGVVAVGADGRVIIANPRAATLLGCPVTPGTAVDEACPPPLAVRVREFLRERGPLGRVGAGAPPDAADAEDSFELTLRGRQLRARLTPLAPRADGGGGGAAVLTVDDLTELARAERVLAWGEMARQVAHEIKNPLTPIRLGVQHLRRARRDGRADFDAILERNVERILAEIDRLDEIARGFSRYGTAPDQRPPADPVDVAAVARDVVALERLGQAPAAVDWRVTGLDGPVVAFARDDELREVLLNLLENARLAGARVVRVDVSRDDGAAVLAVEDDGHGVAEEVIPRVFEPHFSTRTSGSGLGLAISRRLVEGWGGSITLTSERGVGTRVRVALRHAEDPALAPATERSA